MLRKRGSSTSWPRPMVQKSVPASITETFRRSTTEPGPNVVMIWLGRRSPNMGGKVVLRAIDAKDSHWAKVLDFAEGLRRSPVANPSSFRNTKQYIFWRNFIRIG